MKILTIVKNDHITGIEYGMVEIGENIVIKKHQQRYKATMKQRTR